MKRALTLGCAIMLSVATLGFSGDGLPHYNAAPPKKGQKLPPILAKQHRWGPDFQQKHQVRAYELAEQVSDELHQQPCFCYCDRIGHDSLRSCFVDLHGARCPVCMQEVFYTSQQKKIGKTAKQIRNGIIAGEHRKIDLQAAANAQ
jgi:hypothetical protein